MEAEASFWPANLGARAICVVWDVEWKWASGIKEASKDEYDKEEWKVGRTHHM